ncbi:hypothetical protein SADUNF_Sadunf11G0043600 [Salix dunnii]|uniref:Uncharacterized protein n=1 Tax=Salix dunnii TaxID=1413687 RepID=A0A835MT31_9ROSI|nr:hypothetical protein SADUNF_Sadunf11G0043600 [Salix dunnii]
MILIEEKDNEILISADLGNSVKLQVDLIIEWLCVAGKIHARVFHCLKLLKPYSSVEFYKELNRASKNLATKNSTCQPVGDAFAARQISAHL